MTEIAAAHSKQSKQDNTPLSMPMLSVLLEITNLDLIIDVINTTVDEHKNSSTNQSSDASLRAFWQKAVELIQSSSPLLTTNNKRKLLDNIPGLVLLRSRIRSFDDMIWYVLLYLFTQTARTHCASELRRAHPAPESQRELVSPEYVRRPRRKLPPQRCSQSARLGQTSARLLLLVLLELLQVLYCAFKYFHINVTQIDLCCCCSFHSI